MSEPEARPGVLQFVNLPQDVVRHVLNVLDIRSLLVCKLVCRALAHLISSDIFLQYDIELAATGMANTSSGSGLPVTARLALLREYRAAWQSLRSTTEEHIALPRVRRQGYSPVPEIVCDGRVLLRRYCQSCIEVSQVASRARGISWRHWTVDIPVPDLVIQTCAVDSVQDLLIVAEKVRTPGSWLGDVHVRTLSTGAPHPLAASAILAFDIIQFSHSAQFRIRADVVAYSKPEFGLWTQSSEVRLWNWKSSQLIWRWTGRKNIIFSMAFLDGARFITTGPSGLTFHRYDAEAAEPWNDDDDDYVCRLNFPKPVMGPTLHHCQLSSCSHTPTTHHAHTHFDVPSDDPLVLVSFMKALAAERPSHPDQGFDLVIPRRTLLALVDDADAGGGGREFAWNNWCSDDMHIVTASPYLHCDFTVVGWKVLGGSHDMSSNDAEVRVYDFSDLGIDRGDRTTVGAGGGERATRVPPVMSLFPRCFEERINSLAASRVCLRCRVPWPGRAVETRPELPTAMVWVRVISTLDGFVVLNPELSLAIAYSC